MSRRRFIIGNGLDKGLVFHASLKKALTAESGQSLYFGRGSWKLVYDYTLKRNVGKSVGGGSLNWSPSGMPKENESFTMAGWFKADFNTATLMGWGYTPYNTRNAAHYALTNYNGQNFLSMPTGDPNKDYSITAPAELNKWYYLCGTHDEATGKNVFYVNGKKVGESTKILMVGTNSAALGCFWGTQAGNICAANVRIYNRVISKNEADALFNEPL